MASSQFDPVTYRRLAYEQWQNVADGWHKMAQLWWGEWAAPITDLMLDLARIQPGYRVLDVAAGNGDQALKAARRVGAAGSVLATDLAPNFVPYIARIAADAGLQNIEGRAMDGENLKVEDASFDAVICRMGLMLFPDPHKGLTEMRRALKPGGRAAVIVFTTPDKSPCLSMPAMIALRHAQLPPPQPGQPGLFSLGAPGLLEQKFRQAGFSDIETQIVSAPVQLATAGDFVRFLQEAGGWYHAVLSGLDDEGQQAAWYEIGQTLKQFEGSDGFESPCEVLVAVGVKQ